MTMDRMVEYYEKEKNAMQNTNHIAIGQWHVTELTIDSDAPLSTELRAAIGHVNSTSIAAEIEKKLNNTTPYHSFYGSPRIPSITKVIHNPPATIIFWADKTKTVVQTQNGEPYDPEKGFAMAVTKKVYGNKGNYFNTVKKWTEGYKAPDDVDEITFTCNFSAESAAVLHGLGGIANDVEITFKGDLK